MKTIVGSNQELCVGCNRCIRACPIEMANLTYEDGDGNIKTKVDDSKCIACGACVSACKHGARFYQDDMDALLAALAAGERVSLLAAPSLKTNFPKWRNLLAWLRRQGVEKIYDVSLGADICIWAHLRHLERTGQKPLITQPCPAVVSYCEVYRPELLAQLSPVHSPMGCAAVYMREYAGVTGTLAALSPCFAKGREFESTGLVQYNVVFARLQEHLVKNHIELPDEESGFDHDETGLGAVFPMPGGLKENIEFFTGGALRVDRAEGPAVYGLLDEYAGVPAAQLPVVFDVLNCEQGCNIGPGALRDRSYFEINTAMDTGRRQAVQRCREHYEALHGTYDERLELSRFMRGYKPHPEQAPVVTESDIQRAFEVLDKRSYAQQNYNCGACGCETCRDMARRIALGINIPLNCIVKSRDDTMREHQRNVAYVGLVHNVAGHLLNTGEREHSRVVLGAMESLCAAMRANHVSLWKTAEKDGELLIHRLYDWPETGKHTAGIIYEHQLPDWTDNMRRGIPLYLDRAAATQRDKVLFSDPSTEAFQLVPLMVKGKYWGLLSVRFAETHPMNEGEISVISSIGLLVVSSIMDDEMNRRLIEA
ncbi:4Fe-4S binding protein, partial [Ruminococcaceae bacterium OttesenSCG-928-A11]|nr:4Fe-4S binding protein [Ruminococcaceae bacterium OttesenSCG-928-A11]